MIPKPPLAEPISIARFCRDLVVWLNSELSRYVDKRTAIDSMLLQSPNGSVYQITVSDAGVVTSTLVTS